MKEHRQHCWLSRAHEQHQNQTRLIVASIDRLLGCHFLSSSRIKFCDLFGLARRSTSYTTKYTFKAQRPATALTMKLGLVSQAYARTFCASDDENITANERGF